MSGTDPFPAFSHLTLSQLGEIFGVSAIVAGRWLKEIGLRQQNGEPTTEATSAQLFKRVEAGEAGRAFCVWDKRRCVQLFEAAGRKRVGPPPSGGPSVSDLIGPFTARRSDPEGDGFEVVDANGIVGIWLRGERPTEQVVKLLNLAHNKAGWFA